MSQKREAVPAFTAAELGTESSRDKAEPTVIAAPRAEVVLGRTSISSDPSVGDSATGRTHRRCCSGLILADGHPFLCLPRRRRWAMDHDRCRARVSA